MCLFHPDPLNNCGHSFAPREEAFNGQEQKQCEMQRWAACVALAGQHPPCPLKPGRQRLTYDLTSNLPDGRTETPHQKALQE